MQILSSDEKGLSSQQDRQVISKFFQFWAVSLHLDTVPAFYTVLWEKVLIFFTLAFPTNPTTSELIHLLLQMEVGFQAWCFTEKKKSFGTLLWPGTHSTVTEDKNFSSKKKDEKSFFSLTLCTSDHSLQELGSPCCQYTLFGHCSGFLAMHKKFSHYLS